MTSSQFIFWAFVSAGFLTGLVIRGSLSKKGKREWITTLCIVLFTFPVMSFSWGLIKGSPQDLLSGSFLFYSGFLFVFFLLSGFFFKAGVFFLLLYVSLYFWGCWVLEDFSSEAAGDCIEVTVSGEGERPVIEQIRTFPSGISWGTVFFRQEKPGQDVSGDSPGVYNKSLCLFIRVQEFFRTVDLKLTGEERGKSYETVLSDPPAQPFYPACFRIFRKEGGYVMVPVPYY